jgi:hypothetical protein
VDPSAISGFRRYVDEARVLRGHYAAKSGNPLPALCDNELVPSSRVKSKTLEDGTETLSFLQHLQANTFFCP